MFKWIGIIITLLALLTGGYFGYNKFTQQMAKLQSSYDFVTADTDIIIEVNKLAQTFEEIDNTNLLWEGVKNWFTTSAGWDIDQTLKKCADLNLLVIHQKSSWLFIIQHPQKNNSNLLWDYLTSHFSSDDFLINLNQQTFELNQTTFHYALNAGNLIFTTSSEALQDALNTSKNPVRIEAFETVKNTSSENVAMKFFIHTNAQKTIDDFFLNSSQFSTLLPLEWGEWIGLDADITPNELTLRGYTSTVDSLNQQANLLAYQEATRQVIINDLPENTAWFKRYGFSDFTRFRTKLINYQNKDSNEIDPLYRIDTTYSFDSPSYLLPYIDNEIVFAEINQPYTTEETDKMIWIGISDANLVMEKLAALSLATSENSEKQFQVISYKKHLIHSISDASFLQALLGPESFKASISYFTNINDHIVFAENPATLQYCIDKLERKQTLQKSDQFSTFLERQNSSSNLMIYYNPSKFKNRLNHKLSLTAKRLLTNDFLNQYQSLGIQMNYERKNLYYLSLYTSHNPVSKSGSNTLWELQLDTNSGFKPFIFTNHYSKAKEIFTQDYLNNIYLLNSKGKVLWKKKLNEPIISTIKQIDILNNNKFQLVFNTTNSLYVIDRNGNNVSGFPIHLDSKISSEVSVLDYDNSNNYRFIIGLKNGEILNFNGKGQMVKGWQNRSNNKAIAHPIIYGKVKGRDYLIAIYENGEIVALDRRGQTRISFKNTFSDTITGVAFAKFQNQLSSSYIVAQTIDGTLEQIWLNDEKTTIGKYPAKNHLFADTDHDGSIELVFHTHNEITSVELDGHQSWTYVSRDSLASEITYFDFGDYSLIGYQNNSKSKIYLSHTTGELLDEFPLVGSSTFTLFDINRDGRYNVLTTDAAGILKAYQINL